MNFPPLPSPLPTALNTTLIGDRPTEPGYYWLHDVATNASPAIVQLYSYGNSTNLEAATLYLINENPSVPVDHTDYDTCVWTGPLRPPMVIDELTNGLIDDRVRRLATLAIKWVDMDHSDFEEINNLYKTFFGNSPGNAQ